MVPVLFLLPKLPMLSLFAVVSVTLMVLMVLVVMPMLVLHHVYWVGLVLQNVVEQRSQ